MTHAEAVAVGPHHEPRHGPRGAVCLVTTGLSHMAGGPFFSVSGLAAAVGRSTPWEPSVIGAYGDVANWPHDRAQWAGCGLVAMPHGGLETCRRLADAAIEVIDTAAARGLPAVLHVSGLWDAASLAATLVAGRRRVPRIVSPRGMLEPWSLRAKAVKKKVALLLWQRRLVSGAALIHATSHQECASIRAAGFRNPVCVVPNGIALPADVAGVAAPRSADAPRRCVFLSRIHPKKGLPLLVKAWARVRPAGWTLDIAGNTEDAAHEADVRRLAASLGIDSIRFLGEQRGQRKWDLLQQADLFVLPSYSENFGIVVAEALACGVPVIATTGTPWSVLAEQGLGWWVAADEEAIAAALAAAVSEPAEALAARGRRGRQHALGHYGWDQLGRRMAAGYDWVVGAGPATPDIVFN